MGFDITTADLDAVGVRVFSRCRLGPAPQARPVPVAFSFDRGLVKPNIFAKRQARRTRGAAVHACCQNAKEETLVLGTVPLLDGAPALLIIQHPDLPEV